MTFRDFSTTFPDQKMKIHDISAQHIFLNKLYTTDEQIDLLSQAIRAAKI